MHSTSPDTHFALGRRAFLRFGGAAAGVAALSLVGACTPSTPGANSSPGGSKTASKAQLPTYLAGAGAKPDLEASGDGLEAGYLSFPKDWFNAVQQTPSK